MSASGWDIPAGVETVPVRLDSGGGYLVPPEVVEGLKALERDGRIVGEPIMVHVPLAPDADLLAQASKDAAEKICKAFRLPARYNQPTSGYPK